MSWAGVADFRVHRAGVDSALFCGCWCGSWTQILLRMRDEFGLAAVAAEKVFAAGVHCRTLVVGSYPHSADGIHLGLRTGAMIDVVFMSVAVRIF